MSEEGLQDLVGRALGQYEVRSKIGEGGMGAVYLAYDRSLEREVALKVLPPEFARDRQYVQRFEREAKSLARLRHPNLVHIYNVGSQDLVHYFAMEFVRGETLSEYMRKRGQLQEEEVLGLAAQILSALQAIHRLGITHRDIKAANIMIDGPGHAVLMDFGLAKDRQDSSGLTTVGAVLGTPEYMAPEQAQGEEVSPATDMYSFGVLLYEMLAGRLPFVGNSVIATLRAHIEEAPPPLQKIRAGISKPMLRIVRKALAKTAEERYASAADMARDMYELNPSPELKEIAGEARGAKTLPLKPVESRQGLQAVMVAAGVLVLLFALIVVASTTRSRRRTGPQDATPAAGTAGTGEEPEATDTPAAGEIAEAELRLKDTGETVRGRIVGLRRISPDKAVLVVETAAGERVLPADAVDVINYE
ncbi:MAG: serine/threonine protein kinase [Planctomycetes bacterium]|nr:serine/threonine protein kinase [Planctomycetota bacterium]